MASQYVSTMVLMHTLKHGSSLSFPSTSGLWWLLWLLVVIIPPPYQTYMEGSQYNYLPLYSFCLNAKIIRVVITVFLYTVLVYSDGFRKKVWLYDGTIEFLRGKHVILFVLFSFLIFLLLSVLYTLTLMFIQWFQRFSHYRLLLWVHRLANVSFWCLYWTIQSQA